MLGQALVQSIAIKFKAECQVDAVAQAGSGFELLRYRVARHWPGPPAFDFKLELLAESDRVPIAIERAVRDLPEEALIVRTYEARQPDGSEDPEMPFMPLLESEVGVAMPGGEFQAKRIVSQDDIDFVNRTHSGEDLIRAGVLSDARIHTFFVEIERMAVASGSVVIAADSKIGYVADMITLPRLRGRGLGKFLLGTLRCEARRAGCERLILLPSPFAQKSKFYERAGFRAAGGLRVNYFLPRALSSICVVDRPST